MQEKNFITVANKTRKNVYCNRTYRASDEPFLDVEWKSSEPSFRKRSISRFGNLEEPRARSSRERKILIANVGDLACEAEDGRE